jgi:hypothetical protein
MLYRFTLLCLLITIQFSWAKTANVKAYGMQFSVLPTQTSGGTMIYITSYDGSSSSPYQDSSTGFISNEFKQQSLGSSVFRADYMAGDGYGIEEYGSISFNLSNTDSDGNGVPDWLQKENAVNLSVTGSSSLHWQTTGWGAGNTSITGSFTRIAGQSKGNFTVYYKSNSGGYTISASGNWYIRYFEGTLTYDNGSFNLAIQSNDSDGIAFAVSGASTYSSASEDSLTLASTQLSGAVGNIVTKEATFQRNGSVFSGTLELVDGEPDTSWVDYEDWYLEIEDSNDADGDNIPDLSDASIAQSSSGTTLETSGWSYHVWPWVYSNTTGDWLYYANSSNGGMMVWNNLDKSWYLWDSSSASWQKN